MVDPSAKNPVGRPSKYDRIFCERVIALGREGASVVEMAGNIGVCRNTLETVWPEQYPEFLEALVFAREQSQIWWEKTGRTGMLTKGIDSSIWSRSMAARFPNDWREKNQTEHHHSFSPEASEWLGHK